MMLYDFIFSYAKTSVGIQSLGTGVRLQSKLCISSRSYIWHIDMITVMVWNRISTNIILKISAFTKLCHMKPNYVWNETKTLMSS